MLRDFGTTVFTLAGLSQTDASLVTDSLLDADLRGISSHGLVRLPSYISRLENHTYNANPKMKTTNLSDSVVVLEGDHGMGQVVANRALEILLERAKDVGIAAVSVRQSSHAGALGYYTRKGARRKFVTFMFSNSSPGLVPWGGKYPILGNNPWSIAIPTSGDPVCLDMANSVAARGKIRIAKDRGLRIPEGWAVDSEGNPTTDPIEALKGGLLPMAGHKGYGIAVIVDLLASVLSGASFLDDVISPYNTESVQDIGHLFIALDSERFGTDGFEDRTSRYIARLKGSGTAPEKEILIPGEPEERTLVHSNIVGLDPGPTLEELKKVAEKYKVTILRRY